MLPSCVLANSSSALSLEFPCVQSDCLWLRYPGYSVSRYGSCLPRLHLTVPFLLIVAITELWLLYESLTDFPWHFVRMCDINRALDYDSVIYCVSNHLTRKFEWINLDVEANCTLSSLNYFSKIDQEIVLVAYMLLSASTAVSSQHSLQDGSE